MTKRQADRLGTLCGIIAKEMQLEDRLYPGFEPKYSLACRSIPGGGTIYLTNQSGTCLRMIGELSDAEVQLFFEPLLQKLQAERDVRRRSAGR
jgi:hypothetical protein